jgi:hypothetical protein
MIRTPVPCLGVNYALYKSSTAGSMKAIVLPEPVLAAPRTSLPLRICGIDLA